MRVCILMNAVPTPPRVDLSGWRTRWAQAGICVANLYELCRKSNAQNLWMSLGEARKWAHLPEDDLKVVVVLIKAGVVALVGKVRPCSP